MIDAPSNRAISYLRWSSSEQSKGDSLRRQLEETKRYCEEHGLTLDQSLRDEGVSAYDRSNLSGAFGSFLRAVEEGRVPKGTTLIVESLDRLSRAQPTEALTTFLDILRAGISIVTFIDKQVYTQQGLNTDYSKLIISIVIMQRAHEESETKSKRVRAAWENKKRNAKTTRKPMSGRVPLWIEMKDAQPALIPERAELLRQIFTWAKQGIGNHTIVKMLNEGDQCWSVSGRWETGYVQKLLTRPLAYGAITIDGEEIDGYYPAVISKNEFLHINWLRQGRATSQSSGTRKGELVSNIFSGLVYCGYCGSKMVMSQYKSVKQPTPRKFFICNGAKTAATDCIGVAWNYDDIEGSFLFRGAQLPIGTLLGANESTNLKALDESIAGQQSELEKLDQRIANLYTAIEEEPLPGLVARLKAKEVERDEKATILETTKSAAAVERANADTRGSRMALLLRLFREIKSKNGDELRLLREALSAQIHQVVAKMALFPTGPSRNRSNKADRYFVVHFASGEIVEMQ